jgi:hypothetical protein
MASQQVPTASLHLLKVYEGEKGKTFQLMCKSAEREGVKLEVRVSLLGDFEAGKSSLVGKSNARSVSSLQEYLMMVKVWPDFVSSITSTRSLQELHRVKPYLLSASMQMEV